MMKLLKQHFLFMADVTNLPPDSYTYMSRNASCSTSGLDHIVTSKLDIIKYIKISYGITLDDHIPINFVISIENCSRPVNESLPNVPVDKSFIKWDKVSERDLYMYQIKLDYFIRDNE